MRYAWMDEYLRSKTGVTKDLQKDWNWIRYHSWYSADSVRKSSRKYWNKQ